LFHPVVCEPPYAEGEVLKKKKKKKKRLKVRELEKMGPWIAMFIDGF